MSSEPVWCSVKELFKVLREMDMWSMDTKYLDLHLDTRFINNDYHCTIKDRNGNYITIEDLINSRKDCQIK